MHTSLYPDIAADFTILRSTARLAALARSYSISRATSAAASSPNILPIRYSVASIASDTHPVTTPASTSWADVVRAAPLRPSSSSG